MSLLARIALVAAIFPSGCGPGPREAPPEAPAPPRGPFPLGISPDRSHLVDRDGRPFLLQGDSAWSLVVQLSPPDALQYLDDRRQKGFSAILVNLIEHRFSSQSPRWVSQGGLAPFADGGDFTTTNEAYFAHVDWLLRQAEERGILVLLAPCYLGFDGSDEGWCQEMKRNGVDRLRRYGQYVGRRYLDRPNLLWVEGGDYTPKTQGSPSEMDLVRAVVEGIREGDRGLHLHTAHWHPGTSSSEVPGVSWVDVDSTYLYEGARTYVKTLKDFGRDRGLRPFFLIESAYESEHHATPTELRAQMYQPILSGGTGFVFGNFPIWHFWSPGDPAWHLDDGRFPGGWRTALDTPGTRSASICGEFFRSIAWHTLRPDVAHRLVPAGYGTPGSDRTVLAGAATDGRLAVAYFTARLTATLDLSRMAGTIRARWLDPSSGSFFPAMNVSRDDAGPRQFTPPGKNAEGSEDWVLLLQAD